VKLLPGEAEAIAGFIGMAEEEFFDRYTRISPDRTCLSLTETEQGHCVFLAEENGLACCKIDKVKPRQCRDFPQKWSFPGWQKECSGASEQVEK
jgi:Fe-S-cluster containining protein